MYIILSNPHKGTENGSVYSLILNLQFLNATKMVKNIEKNACLFLPCLVQFGPVKEEDWKLKVNRSKLFTEDYEKYKFY